MKIVFHRIDHDGQCSAAILYNLFIADKPQLIGLDYNDNFSECFNIDELDPNEQTYMVDFSLPPEDMIKLWNKLGDNLIWIDHHLSAIRNSERHEYIEIKGVRNSGYAACELTWKFVHGNNPPYPIFLLGKYDIWEHHLDPKILPFHYGLRTQKTKPDAIIWRTIVNYSSTSPQNAQFVDKIIVDGEAIIKYENNLNAGVLKSLLIPIKFNNFKIGCLNRSHISSKVFDLLENKSEFDGFMTFSINREKMCKCTIYSNSPNLDSSQIAESFGGGGHFGAAGFTIPYTQLSKILELS